MPASRSFIGGMNVPTRAGWGRMNASVPLAELTIDDEWVTLRPRWFAALVTGPFRVPLTAVVVAYPVGRRSLASGIGLNTSDEQTAYFWTRRAPDEVLRALADRGVPVDPSQQRPTAVWKLRNPRPTLTQTSPMPPWVIRSLPFSMVAATVLAVIFESSPGPAWWKAWIAVVWLGSLILTFLTWRKSRRLD